MISVSDFGELSTAAVSDALDRFGLPGSLLGLAPLVPGQRLLGRAFTVRYPPAASPPGTVGDYLGVQVRPGDLLVGDADGVVAIAWDRAEEVLAAAREIAERELGILEAALSGATIAEARARYGYHQLQRSRP